MNYRRGRPGNYSLKIITSFDNLLQHFIFLNVGNYMLSLGLCYQETFWVYQTASDLSSCWLFFRKYMLSLGKYMPVPWKTLFRIFFSFACLNIGRFLIYINISFYIILSLDKRINHLFPHMDFVQIYDYVLKGM